MSIQALTYALENSDARGIDKFVLVCIAWHVSGDSGYAWPGIPTLARETGLSEPGVRASIERLIAAGELEYERGGGRGSLSTFTMVGFDVWLQGMIEEKVRRVSKGETKGKQRVSEEKIKPLESHTSTLQKELKRNLREEESTSLSQEDPKQVFKICRGYYRHLTGKGCGNIPNARAEEWVALVEKKTGDVVFEAWKLWVIENKEWLKTKAAPLAMFLKNIADHVEAYEDKIAGEKEAEVGEEVSLPPIERELLDPKDSPFAWVRERARKESGR